MATSGCRRGDCCVQRHSAYRLPVLASVPHQRARCCLPLNPTLALRLARRHLRANRGSPIVQLAGPAFARPRAPRRVPPPPLCAECDNHTGIAFASETAPGRASAMATTGSPRSARGAPSDSPNRDHPRNLGSGSPTLPKSRITRRVASRSATIGDSCSGPAGRRSSSREPVAGRATQEERPSRFFPLDGSRGGGASGPVPGVGGSGRAMPSEPFSGRGLRGSRTRAAPGSRKSEPEMTTLPSSRSRSTSSRRRASIWACNTRRSSETTSSLLVSSCKRDVNSSRASECGSGTAATRPFSCATRITASSTERTTPRSAGSPAGAQFCIHEHPGVSTTSDAPCATAAFGRIRPRARTQEAASWCGPARPPVGLDSLQWSFACGRPSGSQDGVDEVVNDVQLRSGAGAQVGRPAVDRL